MVGVRVSAMKAAGRRVGPAATAGHCHCWRPLGIAEPDALHDSDHLSVSRPAQPLAGRTAHGVAPRARSAAGAGTTGCCIASEKSPGSPR